LGPKKKTLSVRKYARVPKGFSRRRPKISRKGQKKDGQPTRPFSVKKGTRKQRKFLRESGGGGFGGIEAKGTRKKTVRGGVVSLLMGNAKKSAKSNPAEADPLSTEPGEEKAPPFSKTQQIVGPEKKYPKVLNPAMLPPRFKEKSEKTGLA